MNKLLSTEAAWLAGLFEGEGSIGVYRNQPRMSIGQHARSVDVLERVLEIVGIGTIYGPYRQETTPVCFYQINQSEEIYNFIKVVYPYLLKRRQEQCDAVLAHIEQMLSFNKEVKNEFSG